MHTTRRLSWRARAALIVLAVIALAAPARADTDHPPQPIDPWAGLTYAVLDRAAAQQQWYVAVHEQHERDAQRAERARSTQRTRSANAFTTVSSTLDGDRFDRLADCESGRNPATDTGNGFYGAFQFVLSSWHAAGGTGSPVEHSYAEQKAVAMRWASMTNPASQWPRCWPRSA